jgi:hypothetical protein
MRSIKQYFDADKQDDEQRIKIIIEGKTPQSNAEQIRD